MSESGISASLFSYISQQNQSTLEKLKQEFQKLGQDLQSGDLTSARRAYATIQQDLQQLGQAGAQPQSSQPSSTVSVSA